MLTFIIPIRQFLRLACLRTTPWRLVSVSTTSKEAEKSMFEFMHNLHPRRDPQTRRRKTTDGLKPG